MFIGQIVEATLLVMAEDRGDNRFGLVNDLDEIEVAGVDHLLAHELVLEPVQQALPERAANQDHRDLAALAGLDQSQGFHHLVQRAEATGHHHVGRGELDEHDLARKEVAEGLRDVLIRVAALFVGQLDVQADGGALAVKGAFVGRFHDAGATA